MMRSIPARNVVYDCTFSTYRRKVALVQEIQDAAERLVLEIAADKGYEVVAYSVMPDHVHLLVRLPFGGVPRAMNLFKGIMSRRIFQQFPDLRLDMKSNHLWAARYYARTVDVPSVPATIAYIRGQGHEVDDL